MADVKPKCPQCGTEGIEHFASQRSVQSSQSKDPWFFVVYCDVCGHVHAVMPKHVFAETRTKVVVQDSSEATT